MEKLFALAGKARSGKDYTASLIKDYYKDKKVLIYSNTYYLKKYVSKIYGWDGNDETKPRETLQLLGKKVKEKYPNILIDRMEEDIKLLSNYCDILIVTGVRLENEIKFLKKAGAILIKMERPDVENNLSKKEKQDVTETDVDKYHDYDYIVENTGEDLKQKIEDILEVIK